MKLTRQYRFAASHRLHSPRLSEAENQEIFGKCNNPFGHGHDYLLRVTAEGEPDPETGLLCNLASLDRLIEEKVLLHASDRNLNDWDVFAGGLVPTTENLAEVVASQLAPEWAARFPAGPQLTGVTILETRRNTVELRIGQ